MLQICYKPRSRNGTRLNAVIVAALFPANQSVRRVKSENCCTFWL